ncbi:MAG: tautomerase family protein [Oscillospiraceae bacterium]|nr:tautomerase family protein [Oscillospiraceae bacterium]
MPIVRIDMIRGKSAEYKRTYMECVHSALVEAFGIPEWDRFQRIVETDRENVELPEGKTEDFAVIELTIFPGRTVETKERAVSLITDKLVNELSVAPTDVFIIINEPPLENWGLGGRMPG